ncbi:MAG TPA: MFS transporter [Kouleothrix sp.]|uniref:MFS transporter n=1 Tax=Kouleothrix sp. TaxID=2779161 RepID=UPI002CA72084|nr:MFS transporter [Kouleothrix sp.]
MITNQPIASIAWQPRAVFALLFGYLALFGVLIGGQGVLWAEIIGALQLSKSMFGLVQLASPILSVVLLVAGAQLAHWLGKKSLAIVGLALLAVSQLALAEAGGLALLLGALLLSGAGNALLETAANSATLDWEHATGRSVMNLMHAGFSAGAVLGAFAAGLLLGQGWRYPAVLTLLALLCMLLLLISLPVRFPPAESGDGAGLGPADTLRLLLGMPVMLALAVVCVLGVIGESVSNLWSVIYLHGLGADALLGGATFALFNGAMFAGRLANSWVVARWGARASLLASGLGLVLANVLLLPGILALAIAGFALMGLSVAGIVPTVLTAGARLAPGRSAAVAGGIMALAYTGFVICPPITGLVADLVSLRAALLIVGASGIAILVLACRLPPSR